MPKVFISHSWDDNDMARKLAADLKRDGAEIWIDYARISGGDSLPDRISDALEWCDTLVLVWTVSAAASYYVKLEWQSALDLRKRIIPFLLNEAPRPAILRSFLYIPVSDFNKGYAELVRALELPKKKERVKHAGEKEKTAKKPIPEEPSPFRSTPQQLSKDDVKQMLLRYDFCSKEYDWNKDYSHPTGKGFVNLFEAKTISGEKVVNDQATGLMWQQSGSPDYMTKEDVDKWINSLNAKRFAGYKDWRLPTLEETMSLMEPTMKNGDLYIDPVFDKTQRWIWTCDPVEDEPRVWVVYFDYGSCYNSDLSDGSCVRAVRSLPSSE